MEILKCEKLCMNYDNNAVLCNLSFSINEGDFLSIVGENGSGKSTLVKGLLGLMKHKGGIEFTGIKPSQIGYLPQNTLISEDFPATVHEVVLSGSINSLKSPFYGKTQKQRAGKALETMQILELKSCLFRNLSGGQKQRVLLARALCAADKMLLLDEPANGLDPMVKAELYEIIRSLNKKELMTVIMISHDFENALKYANKILHISENHDNCFFGTVIEYKQTVIYKAMGGVRA